jgi:hypothetical protein
MTTEKEFHALIKLASQPVESWKKKEAPSKTGRYSDKRTHPRNSASKPGKPIAAIRALDISGKEKP